MGICQSCQDSEDIARKESRLKVRHSDGWRAVLAKGHRQRQSACM